LRAPAIWAGALGYLVDIYDLNVGSNYRQDIFQAFGVPKTQTVEFVAALTWWSRIGLLAGGFLWGILGDRTGRVFSLFGSIGVYSLAALWVAFFVHSFHAYAVGTLLIGFGLAGELGGSVTLVMESLSNSMRTFGVMVVAAMGMLGVLLAGALAEFLDWRTGFAVGGFMGLALLIFRYHVRESLLFQEMETKKISRGNWFKLLWPWTKLQRYLASILIGVPALFVLFFYTGFAPELSRELHYADEMKLNRAAMAVFLGLAFGDLLFSWLSFQSRSRKRPILWCMGGSAVIQTLILNSRDSSSKGGYALLFLLGIFTANAVYVAATSEQFGTDLRDTATTTITNFFRFGIMPLVTWLTYWQASAGLLRPGVFISLMALALGVFALSRLRETYGANLDYTET
jgi:putative MFS transporter